MKSVFALIVLFALVGCSRGSGVFRGVATDVSWEGYLIPSCEITLKTSEQSSHQEFISSTDQGLCSSLQETIGKPLTVKYTHVWPSLRTDTNYIIQSVE